MKPYSLLVLIVLFFVGCLDKNEDGNTLKQMKVLFININSEKYKDYTDQMGGFLETYYGDLVTLDLYNDEHQILLTIANDSLSGLIKKQLFDSSIKFNDNIDERDKECCGFTLHQITYNEYKLPPCLMPKIKP